MLDMKYEGIAVVIFGQHCLNTLGQIRSVGRLGIRPDVVWVSKDYHSPKGSKWINRFQRFSSFEEGLDYIIKTYTDVGKRYFISTDSDEVVSLLDLHYDQLNDRFYFFNAGEQGRLSKYMPKYDLCKLAERHGINAPKSELVFRGQLPVALSFPIFTKSPNSKGMSWKENAKICRNKDELEEAYKTITTDTILLQEYVEKENEIAIEGVSFNGGKEIYVPIQGKYLRIKDGAFGTWKKNETYCLGEDLLNRIKSVFQEIGYSGIFEVEFLKDKKGGLYFLEINFRHTQYNHAITRMGVNLFEIWMNSILQGSLNYDAVKKIKSPWIVINDPKDFRTYVETGQIGMKQWLNDMKSSDSYYMFDKEDKLFVVKYITRSIIRRVKKRIKRMIK